MSTHSTSPSPRYVIVSPVKDEERHVELTLRSVIGQTVKPVVWVIVDDGSTDSTPATIRHHLATHPFIRLETSPWVGRRHLAFSEVRAFNWGREFIGSEDYDFIVKLDCDLSFEPDYFEKLLDHFIQNERLGIASGVYFEMGKAGAWGEVSMPFYHAAGASKVIRKACFEDIGDFIPGPGWDTADEIRAMHRGWETRHFRELRMRHHKREGSSIGAVKTGVMQGEAYYRTGGSGLFFALKALHRVAVRPYLVSALALMWGYLKARLEKKELLVTEAEARDYRILLRGRMVQRIRSFIRLRWILR
jgi:biofilm PGA synthesis N-glycosyltransferase PgaC